MAMAFVVWGFALTGCSLPRVEQRAASGKQVVARQAEAAYHEMFEQTVPSIEAALPLATVVDSIVRGDADEFVSRAWFSGGQPVCMKVYLIESGDTTAMDHYYYQRGRFAAWFKTAHWRKGEPGWPHHVLARALIGPNGKPRRVEVWKDGAVIPVESSMAAVLIRMSLEMESGLLEILARKASRTASPS